MNKNAILLLLTFTFLYIHIYSQQDSLNIYSNEMLFDKAEVYNKTIYLDKLYTRRLNNNELLDYYEKYTHLTFQKADYQKSKLKNLELLKFSQKIRDPHYALIATLNLMDIEFVSQNYKNCEYYYSLTKNIAKELPISFDKYVVEVDIEYFHHLFGNFDKYIEKSETNIAKIKKLDTRNKVDADYVKNITAGLLIYLADAYVMHQNFNSAQLRLKEGEGILRKNFPEEILTFDMKAELVKAKLFLFQKKYKESISILERTLKIAQQNNFDDVAYQSKVFLAINYFNINHYQKSLLHAESAMKTPQKIIDFIDFDVEAKRYAYLSSKKMNLNEKSIHYADLYINNDNNPKNEEILLIRLSKIIMYKKQII